MRWIELSVAVHPEAVDAVANVFQEHGTGGVAIDQPIETDREGELEPRFVGLPVVKAYLPKNERAAGLEEQIERALWHLQAFDLSPVGPMRRREIEEEDWAEGWKDHFHPLNIGRVVIKPTWRMWNAQPDETVVELDPGMAFGTGLHPTTKLTLLALQRRVKPSMRVLDLGTGSGILAIPAALLGARVLALDVSDVAVQVARQNVIANRVERSVEVAEGSLEAVGDRRFDLILANIIAGVLIELAPRLAAALEPKAELLASGIIDERAEEVRNAFRAAGLTVVEEESEGDWWVIVARRDSR
jgi:ribosomal protein L11 methyltransferase